MTMRGTRRTAGAARLLVIILGAALLGVLAARAMLQLRSTSDLPVVGSVPSFTLTDQTGASFSSRCAGISVLFRMAFISVSAFCSRT